MWHSMSVCDTGPIYDVVSAPVGTDVCGRHVPMMSERLLKCDYWNLWIEKLSSKTAWLIVLMFECSIIMWQT